MRSPREIAIRLRQEARNLLLLRFPPRLRMTSEPVSPLPGLPDPGPVIEGLRGTDFAAETVQVASQILEHRFPVFGSTLETGPTIEWRRDYQNNKSTPPSYFRLVPYLDVNRAGDHKNIWELNRHQHLVLLAQASLFTGDRAHLDEIWRELESWWAENPFQRGINWASALEVAFRAVSWIWIYHLVGREMSPAFRKRFCQELYRHGWHIENNLSFYFSPNTHLLGEAVALHALGRLFPDFPRSRTWARLGAETVEQQMDRQVRPDGSHFEQSTYYHVYALDMFLFHALLHPPSKPYLTKLSAMADFLHALLGPERSLPFFGDDDGGRWFHPYGKRDQFGRATIATCALFLNRSDWSFETSDLYPQAAWWLGTWQGSGHGSWHSRRFDDSGLAVFEAEGCRVIMDTGSFGPGRAGHSHSDALSLVASANGKPVLVDQGTFTYVGSPEWRDSFRASSAHNTVQIDGHNQATAMGPFWWANPATVRVLRSTESVLEAECRYAGFVHTRTVRMVEPCRFEIIDVVNGSPGLHDVEQRWHLADHESKRHLIPEPGAVEEDGWHSPVFGQKIRIPCIIVKRRAQFPITIKAFLDLTQS